MFAVSDQVLTALGGSYEAIPEVWLLRDPPVRVPIVAGEVRAAYNSQVARTAALALEQRTVEELGMSVLTDQVMVRIGVRDLISIPVFTGRIDSIDIDEESGSVDTQCVDRGADVIRARFEAPYVASGLYTVIQDMQLLLIDADGAFVSTADPLIVDSPNPQQMWEEDRGQALDELAASVNAIWMADRSGGFTIFRNPYSLTSEPPGVLALRNGSNGTIVRFRGARARPEVANSVTVVTERTDGSAPIRVTVRDTNPTSPTYWGGPFGKQNIVVKNQTPTDAPEAARMARRLLQQRLAVTRTWNISTPMFPILDPGDVVTVVFDGDVTLQVVEQITYPLLAVNETSIVTRQWQHMEDIS